MRVARLRETEESIGKLRMPLRSELASGLGLQGKDTVGVGVAQVLKEGKRYTDGLVELGTRAVHKEWASELVYRKRYQVGWVMESEEVEWVTEFEKEVCGNYFEVGKLW